MKLQSERVLHLLDAVSAIRKNFREAIAKINVLKNTQNALAVAFHLPLKDNGAETWKLFRASCTGLEGIEARVLALESSGLVFASLAETEGDTSLLDLAVTHYFEVLLFLDSAVSRSSKELYFDVKQNLLRCIEILAAHGSQLSEQLARQRLDWPSLSKVLPYLGAVTPQVLSVQKALIEYTQQSQEDLRSPVWCLFHSVATKEQRRNAVQAVVVQFFLVAGLPWSQQEQRILEAAKKAQNQAQPGVLRKSSLFSSLASAERRAEHAPLLPLGGGEMKTMIGSSYGSMS